MELVELLNDCDGVNSKQWPLTSLKNGKKEMHVKKKMLFHT